MTGKRKPLTPAQMIALSAVVAQNKRLRDAKAEIETRIRAEMSKEMDKLELAYAMAIRRAREAGIPISRIGREGMGTSDPATPKRWLERTEGMVDGEGQKVGAFTWEDRDAQIVRVNFPAYPSSVPQHSAQDYPEILSGLVQRNAAETHGWKVIEDESDQESPAGVIPGWLHWEVESVSPSHSQSIVAALNEWAAAW